MKRPDNADRVLGPNDFPDDKWRKLFPTIVEYMSCEKWEDGKARAISTVQLKLQDGRILASLSDHDLQRGLYVAGEHVEAALKALERALTSDNADWRYWGGGKKKK